MRQFINTLNEWQSKFFKYIMEDLSNEIIYDVYNKINCKQK